MSNIPPTEPPPPYEPDLPHYNVNTTEDDDIALLPVYAELFPEQSTDPSSANGDNNDRMDNTQRRTNHTVFREKIAFLCTPVGIVAMCLVLAVIPLAMVIMGSLYFHRCKLTPFIPIFNLVFGSVSLSVTAVHLIKLFIFDFARRSSESNHSIQSTTKKNSCEVVTVIFLVIWFLLGSFYTFRTWRAWSEDGSVSCTNGETHGCCDPAIMYFTIVMILLLFTVTISTVFIGCFCCCLLSCMSRWN